MRLLRWLPLAVFASCAGCASFPPGPQPKPYDLKYAKLTLVALKPTWILTNPDSVRDARVGKLQILLADQAVVCVAVNRRDARGNPTGLKPSIVFIAPDHNSIIQVIEPNGSFPCRPDELEPFPELNGTK